MQVALQAESGPHLRGRNLQERAVVFRMQVVRGVIRQAPARAHKSRQSMVCSRRAPAGGAPRW